MFENVDLDKIDMLALALSDLEPVRQEIQQIASQVLGDFDKGEVDMESMEVFLRPQTFASLYSAFCLMMELLIDNGILTQEEIERRCLRLQAIADAEDTETGKLN